MPSWVRSVWGDRPVTRAGDRSAGRFAPPERPAPVSGPDAGSGRRQAPDRPVPSGDGRAPAGASGATSRVRTWPPRSAEQRAAGSPRSRCLALAVAGTPLHGRSGWVGLAMAGRALAWFRTRRHRLVNLARHGRRRLPSGAAWAWRLASRWAGPSAGRRLRRGRAVGRLGVAVGAGVLGVASASAATATIGRSVGVRGVGPTVRDGTAASAQPAGWDPDGTDRRIGTPRTGRSTGSARARRGSRVRRRRSRDGLTRRARHAGAGPGAIGEPGPVPAAMSPGGRVGATTPAVSATVARTRLKSPMATTRRAR